MSPALHTFISTTPGGAMLRTTRITLTIVAIAAGLIVAGPATASFAATDAPVPATLLYCNVEVADPGVPVEFCDKWFSATDRKAFLKEVRKISKSEGYMSFKAYDYPKVTRFTVITSATKAEHPSIVLAGYNAPLKVYATPKSMYAPAVESKSEWKLDFWNIMLGAFIGGLIGFLIPKVLRTKE